MYKICVISNRPVIEQRNFRSLINENKISQKMLDKKVFVT